MASFLEDLLKKMQNAPHVGIPPVTNPKVPTKVERDAAEYAARQKGMSNFQFGGGHPTPIYADPAFHKRQPREIDEAVFDAEFQAYLSALRAKQKQKQNETIE